MHTDHRNVNACIWGKTKNFLKMFFIAVCNFFSNFLKLFIPMPVELLFKYIISEIIVKKKLQI